MGCIQIKNSSEENITEIKKCQFINLTTTGYGHSGASIMLESSIIYNVRIYDCVFNNPESSNNVHGGKKGRAISCYDNYNIASINNCMAYCNSYNGSGDTNVGIVESECQK